MEETTYQSMRGGMDRSCQVIVNLGMVDNSIQPCLLAGGYLIAGVVPA